eukprot:58026-Chlamydomonas_euryale.AAC.1
MERLAELTTKFTQNILADESEFTLPLSEADMSGCPPELVAAAKQVNQKGRRVVVVYVVYGRGRRDMGNTRSTGP